MLALYYVTLQCGRKNIFRQIKKKICQQKVEKTSQKSCILMTVGSFFSLSAALTAQNSPELHFCFINSPIQSSVLKSVVKYNTINQVRLVCAGKCHPCTCTKLRNELTPWIITL